MLCPKAVLSNCLFYTAKLSERAMDYVKEDYRELYRYKQTIWVCGALSFLLQRKKANTYARILGLIYFIQKHNEIGTRSATSSPGRTGVCQQKCTTDCRKRSTLKECRWSMQDIVVDTQD
jgi:hypothetical protein